MTPAVARGVCIVHFDPPRGEPAQLYPSGWRCEPPNHRRDHPLTPKSAEEATR